MSVEIIIVLIIVLVAIFLFATEVISIDLTAFLVMVTLMISGIVTPEEGISGFSNTATITILALFILSAGLEVTGAINLLGKYMIKLVGRSQKKALVFVLLFVGFISAFLNNTAVVVILMPIIIRLAHFTSTSASKFLMPLSFAAMVGGSCTVIGSSTNILVSEISASYGFGHFSMFEFSGLGFIIFIVFFIFMILFSKRLIPGRRHEDTLTADYDINDYLTELIITPDSPFAGKRLEQIDILRELQMDVLEISRHDGSIWLPEEEEELQVNDSLLVKLNVNDLIAVQNMGGIAIKTKDELSDSNLRSEETTLIEVVVSPNSQLNRKTIRSVDFRNIYGSIPLAVRRRGMKVPQKLDDLTLRFGDDLLLETRKDYISSFVQSQDFFTIKEIEKPVYDRNKILLCGFIITAVVLIAALELLPILVTSLAGCALMFLTKCITIREAYRTVEWKIIFLLAGLIPLGIAIENTGAGELLSRNLFDFVGSSGPLLAISVIFLVTAMLTSVMSNNAAAILLAPIAVNLALQMGLDPKGLLLTVMFAANTSFITPVGYQTNTLIYGPGNYKFSDFFRVGGILSLIIWVMVTFLIYIFYYS